MRTVRIGVLIAALVVGVVATACTSRAHHVSTTASAAAPPGTASAGPRSALAPVLAHSATNAPSHGPTLRTCRADAIRAQWISYAPDETSERGAVIGLTNESREPCTMSGYPTVEAFNAHGHRLSLQIIDGRGYVTSARPRPVPVQPNSDAEFILANQACPYPRVAEPPSRHVAFLTVGIPSAPEAPLRLHISAMHLPVTAVPLCPGTGVRPNNFAVSPVEPNLRAAI